MVDPRPVLSRRSVLALGGAASLVGVAGLQIPQLAHAEGRDDSLFTLGVASGDPLPDGVVLWTRLASDPTAPDGSGGITAHHSGQLAGRRRRTVPQDRQEWR